MNLEEAIQQLKDAMTVTASMALRQETRVKEHEGLSPMNMLLRVTANG